ncbi:MAG: 2OG-Fe(II) oxygenase [Oceanococcaceae bacterium]
MAELIDYAMMPPAGAGALHAQLADDIRARGYSVMPDALPWDLADCLATHVYAMEQSRFRRAGVGRRQDHRVNRFVRTDEIAWITGDTPAGARWLSWAADLQQALNRLLLLGLFSFESHFAHYAPGRYYRRHYDAFRGSRTRVLSIVAYLNPHWHPDDGGELVLYRDDDDRDGLRVTPHRGTVVAFLSEDFPHEVLPARRDRYSIAGWFRVNEGGALPGVSMP